MGNAILSYGQIEGYWIAAGGPENLAATMAAITGAESSFRPGAIQAGQPYATTGWGLWQITPGDSEPSIGIDHQLLDPLVNARAAVAKWRAGGLRPWTTWVDGAYRQFYRSGVPAIMPSGGYRFIPGTVQPKDLNFGGNLNTQPDTRYPGFDVSGVALPPVVDRNWGPIVRQIARRYSLHGTRATTNTKWAYSYVFATHYVDDTGPRTVNGNRP